MKDDGATSVNRIRLRRSCLTVPGSSMKMLLKSRELGADEVIFDIEDSVAPLAKADARKNIIEVLNQGGFGSKTRVVRINDATTQWSLDDATVILEGAGSNIDCLMLPKVQSAEQVRQLDLLITEIEKKKNLSVGKIGIEVQIENARGVEHVYAIAGSSPRVETIIFGPADFMASINMRSLVVGEQPKGYDVGDAYHFALMSILMAARSYGKQAIDGPYLQIKDEEGYRRVGGRSAALGFDGKWVLHPSQIAAANEIYSPNQKDYEHAELILDAYAYWTSREGGARGAVMLGDEMIDEASRKMAENIALTGRAAGLLRSHTFSPPAS